SSGTGLPVRHECCRHPGGSPADPGHRAHRDHVVYPRTEYPVSELVVGVGAAHSTLMNTHWAEVDDLDAAHRFRDGLGAARAALAEQRPDALVVIGSNHFRGMFLALMPAFTIGVGEVNGAGEAQTPGGPLPVDTALART